MGAVYSLIVCTLLLYHSNADISRPRAECTSHVLLFVGPQLIRSQNSPVGRPSCFHQQEPCSVHLFIQNTASHCCRVWELEQRIQETMFLISQSLPSASPQAHCLALPDYYAFSLQRMQFPADLRCTLCLLGTAPASLSLLPSAPGAPQSHCSTGVGCTDGCYIAVQSEYGRCPFLRPLACKICDSSHQSLFFL